MLFMEITAIYVENHMKPINAFYVQNAKILNIQYKAHVVTTVL